MTEANEYEKINEAIVNCLGPALPKLRQLGPEVNREELNRASAARLLERSPSSHGSLRRGDGHASRLALLDRRIGEVGSQGSVRAQGAWLERRGEDNPSRVLLCFWVVAATDRRAISEFE
jgi:hypothetical protein